MTEMTAAQVREFLDKLYRSESRRVLATLIRLLGDFDAAEEALHEAFRTALEKWPVEGIPSNPRAWLISAGRFRAIDAMRRQARFDPYDDSREQPDTGPDEPDSSIDDDRLRLIFTCCHPLLPPNAQVALTLREVCGLTTEEIARAFLVPSATLAQRIVRAKARIREARIPYQVPSENDLPTRLGTVLRVIYLVFNEGYAASSGTALTRHDLSEEAIRLGRLLVELLPEGEAIGLLALMVLQESRREARTTSTGEIVLLEEQDRSLWRQDMIAEGSFLVERALRTQPFGVYTIQAAIASVHANAERPAATDWPRIVGLYDMLLRMEPSPVIELNRAVAVAMRDGPPAGLELIEALLARGALGSYHLLHSARADLLRRLGNVEEARASYHKALDLVRLEPERRFLQRRIHELG